MPPVSAVSEGDKGLRPLVAQNVIVLAKNFTLSQPQFDLLNRGLKFIPTVDIGKNQKGQLELDIHNYHRKVKLAAYFKNSKKRNVLPFMETSTWTPPLEGLPPEIGWLIEKDWQTFKEHYKFCKNRYNLARDEVKALRELMHNKHIVIKPADKGSAVVVLSRAQYIFEAERQLKDAQYYQKLQGPIYMQTIPMVEDILTALKDRKYINAKQHKYLKGDRPPRERRFYLLPKIHKNPEKWTVPFQIPPGRPIVSDCDSDTYRTAEFIDFYLNPLSVRHPAYIRDTYHFIDIVKNLQIPPDSLFFSMDVVSLYTNIDTHSGLCAVRKVFQKYPDSKRPDDELLQLLEINLTRNDFVFNGQYYLQVKGTAMGKRFAPAYANIFMATWEGEALEKCPKKPFIYLRYLDDIWGIWTGSIAEFEAFVEILNSQDSSIAVEYQIDSVQIDFLDTTVYKGPNFTLNHRLDIKVHFKSTDTHALLYKTSWHPKHTFRGIVKSQLIRFQRICTQQSDFMEAVRILFKALRSRGYVRSFLRKCLQTFQARKEEDGREIIPLITTFSSTSGFLNRNLKSNFERLISTTEVIPNCGVILAYRRNKNLQDLLVQAKLPSLGREGPLMAEEQFCRLNFIRNNWKRTIFKISQQFSPRSQNCIYVIFCFKCGKQYVGETRHSISTQLTQHRYSIRHSRQTNTPLVQHFLFHGWESVRVAGLQRNLIWTDQERKKAESRWIFCLDTKRPLGLNLKYN